MFSGWQTFYQLTGSAAAELIGLMFIVATLTRGQPQPGTSNGQKLFTTPSVFHLALVLIVSALALAPGIEHDFACLLMMAVAVGGCIYALPIAVRIARIKNPTHPSDFWYYGAAPAVLCGALAMSCGVAFLRMQHAAYAVGLTLLALLMVAIRNSWDLVTWLAPRRPPS